MITKKDLPKVELGSPKKLRIMAEPEEIQYLYYEASKGGDICEIGTGVGGGAVVMATALENNNRDGKVYTIGWQAQNSYYRKADKTINESAVSHRIEYIKKKSEDAIQLILDINLRPRFLYIDGDHSYEGVSKDIQIYKDIVLPGGVIAFHDTNKEPVARAIRDNLDWEQIVEVGRIKAYTR